MLHILTSDAIIARHDFERVATSLMETAGPRAVLHLRSRSLTGQAYLSLAKRLAAVSRSSGASLVVNGRLDIAITAAVNGIQLGRGAIHVTHVRRIAPHLRIGLSIHSILEAQSATDYDWLIVGPIYPTATHPGTQAQGLSFLMAAVQAAPPPVLAIGGVKAEHLPSILDTGASGVAVASGIWNEHDPNRALTSYLWTYADWASRAGHDPDRKRITTRSSPGDYAG